MVTAARTTSAMFAVGPARAIQAARLGVLHGPVRIVRGTCEAERPARQHHRQERKRHHAERFTLYVWAWVECDLPPVIRRQVAAAHRRPGVCRLMQGRGKQEHDVIDQTIPKLSHRGAIIASAAQPDDR